MINYKETKKIGSLSWFKTNSFSNYIYIPNNLYDLIFFLKNKPQHLFINTIGAFSNTLFRDGGVLGVIIRLGLGFSYIKNNFFFLKVGCAISLPRLSIYAMNKSIYGFHFLKGIPGTIGGGIFMNSGCYSNEISKVLYLVKALHMHTFQVKSFFVDELLLYRKNKISFSWIFVEAIFKIRFGIKNNINNQISCISKLRFLNQPRNIRNSGSTFKNLLYFQVWKILKRSRILNFVVGGGANFSRLHSNFLINKAKCSALDIENLIILIKYIIDKKFSFKIYKELKFFGLYKCGI